MSRKRIEPLYRKKKISIGISYWIISYLKENRVNISQLVEKLLKDYLKGKNGDCN
jgi:hypothetical protein